MRVPVSIVLLLVVAVITLVWWQGTLKADFLTPPTAERLAIVKASAAREYSPASPAEESRLAGVPVSTNAGESASGEEEAKGPDLGDLETLPGLEAYAADSSKGAEYLIKLATALEAKGAFQRAFLAWERVLDLGKADPDAYGTALSAVKRLRPTLPAWNIDPEASIPVVIHLGTGPSVAAQLKPVLDEVAHQLGGASAGILTVTVDIAVGKKLPNPTSPVPAALWLSGVAKDAPSTAALSFTVEDPAALREQVLRIIYGLVTEYLTRQTAYNPPAPLPATEDPLEGLTYRVTRLCWRELGTGLNLPPPPPPAPPAQPANPGQKSKPSKPDSSKPSSPKPSVAKPVAPRATPAPARPSH